MLWLIQIKGSLRNNCSVQPNIVNEQSFQCFLIDADDQCDQMME